MSYWDIADMARDADLFARVTACAASEQIPEPVSWATSNMLAVTAAPGWDQAWASAIEGDLERPGRDPAVIHDDEILASVQQLTAGRPRSRS